MRYKIMGGDIRLPRETVLPGDAPHSFPDLVRVAVAACRRWAASATRVPGKQNGIARSATGEIPILKTTFEVQDRNFFSLVCVVGI